MTSVSRAYAQLGLAPGASAELLRKRYKALVRTWHPDRFAGDPQGQAEASLRLRAINEAYHLLIRLRPPGPNPPAAPRPPGEALSREEIDRIVQALGTDGPVDLFLAALRVVGRAIWIPMAVVSLALLGLRLLLALVRGDATALPTPPAFFLVPVAVSVVLTAWYFRLKAPRGRG